MNVSVTLAQEIVEQMKQIINQEVNYMNQKGIIIASTDPDRIGNFHGGAKTVIETDQNLIIEYDQQFTGTKKGINIPVRMETETIGVIGITGEKEEVEKYGEIIKKMTEILIKENYLNTLSFQKREQDRLLIETLRQHKQWDEQTKTQLSLLDFDRSLNYTCVVGKPSSYFCNQEHVYHGLDHYFTNNQSCHYTVLQDTVYLLFKTDLVTTVTRELNKLNHFLFQELKLNYHFGISPMKNAAVTIYQHFKQAEHASAWALVEAQTIVLYQDMDLGLLVTTMKTEAKTAFVDKVLGSIPEKERETLKEILLTYGANNKSINKSCETLFIHKNTFQYRLNKLKDYTGYDPKDINDYVKLYLAFILDD
ncbi:CdaR family transcriptional regulator [Amphibacillus cookii]|uniref:CdaR family transcriptional regulator n=1 Tax=Amphibacillus cookii TaxID=767787 RepID=UPI001959D8E1|nr:sugar diacid recognition domain-containing protein [Amphibacillus cookii]MBM7539795.1 carbohydrate diacid regulator [Amphibacillus cookii]